MKERRWISNEFCTQNAEGWYAAKCHQQVLCCVISWVRFSLATGWYCRVFSATVISFVVCIPSTTSLPLLVDHSPCLNLGHLRNHYPRSVSSLVPLQRVHPTHLACLLTTALTDARIITLVTAHSNYRPFYVQLTVHRADGFGLYDMQLSGLFPYVVLSQYVHALQLTRFTHPSSPSPSFSSHTVTWCSHDILGAFHLRPSHFPSSPVF